ncbi:hypothetical protein Pmani_010285 [Petrolisthes manimaculis]|uniref:Uncharacterized protein n=1 Tax=Petrolisthes manimaculis TaxID=1843537 RepID=A0AAE1Q4T0_9EUCA|nr:hypothetical protein Pmani_010285 [Petrolisthes manimaculis]
MSSSGEYVPFYLDLHYPTDDVDDKGHDWSTMILSPLLTNPSNSSTLQGVPFWLDGRPYPLVQPNRASYKLDMVQPGGRLVHPQVLGSQISPDSMWDVAGKGAEGVFMPHSPRSGPHSSPNRYKNMRAPGLSLYKKLHLSKRSEGGKIPTMGLGKRSTGYVSFLGIGVLSDLRKFFNELRTNLDSVEEVAALSQEQGLSINPEDFLALLAQHEARVEARKGGSGKSVPTPPQSNKLMFGYTPDNQPYAHSGLGK